jgi:hypothetical protein
MQTSNVVLVLLGSTLIASNVLLDRLAVVIARAVRRWHDRRTRSEVTSADCGQDILHGC